MGRMFSSGLFFLSGFCSGHRKPWIIAVGTSPVSAVMLKMLAISWWNDFGAYFKNSAWILSGPAALSIPSLLTMDVISSPVKGVVILHDGESRYSLSIWLWIGLRRSSSLAVLSERGGLRCSVRHVMLEYGICDCELIFSNYAEEFLTVVVCLCSFGEFA